MEAKELMVGDWVYNHRNWECPVVEIHKNSAVVIARHYGEEEFLLSDLRPIPLTAEILENNGFKFTNPWYELNNLGIIFSESGIRLSLTGKLSVYINYVHELQHALRLCGSKELADNFKV